jgi:hypothetical protein
VLVYSKDRPFQLQQFLRSFQKWCLKQGQYFTTTNEDFKTMVQLNTNFWLSIHVLYTYTTNEENPGPFKSLYAEVVNEFAPWVNFVQEDGTIEQIRKLIKYTPPSPSYFQFKPYFSFMVDDMFFFRSVSLQKCLLSLEAEQNAYAVHLKLSPNICFSHTNNKLIRPP